MALLQISEPGQSPAPHQRRLAVGIDLGTTHSLVASVRSSVAEVLTDEQGIGLIPSAVYIAPGGETEIGRAALEHLAQRPLDTLLSTKRLMGRSYEEALASGMPYHFVADGQSLQIVTQGGSLSVIDVASRILSRLKTLAEGILGDLPPGCFAVVGCDSLRAVAEAARAGAAAVVVKEEAWRDAQRPQGSFQENGVAGAMEELRSAASLSD